MTEAAKLDHRELLEQAASLLSDHPLIACGLRGIAAELDRSSSDPDAVRASEHALVRFECLADQFEEAGDTASWAMASVDADRMRKALDVAHRRTPAESINQFEKTEAGIIDWKAEAERANRLLAAEQYRNAVDRVNRSTDREIKSALTEQRPPSPNKEEGL